MRNSKPVRFSISKQDVTLMAKVHTLLAPYLARTVLFIFDDTNYGDGDMIFV